MNFKIKKVTGMQVLEWHSQVTCVRVVVIRPITNPPARYGGSAGKLRQVSRKAQEAVSLQRRTEEAPAGRDGRAGVAHLPENPITIALSTLWEAPPGVAAADLA